MVALTATEKRWMDMYYCFEKQMEHAADAGMEDLAFVYHKSACKYALKMFNEFHRSPPK